MKWHKRFLDLADHISSWSKDPSTRVGAVVVRPDRTIASLGFNGFPRSVDDTPSRYSNREVKYQFICHAEANAIVSTKGDLSGHILYSYPLHPCNECAKLVIQSGITTVVTKTPTEERWSGSFNVASQMFAEAGVKVILID